MLNRLWVNSCPVRHDTFILWAWNAHKEHRVGLVDGHLLFWAPVTPALVPLLGSWHKGIR